MHIPVHKVAVGSFVFYEPVTFATNVLLGGCCIYFFFVLSRQPRDLRQRGFMFFFICMAVSMMLGGIAHLLHAYFDFYAWRRPAFLFTGLSVFAAQMGVMGQMYRDWRKLLIWLASAQLLIYCWLILFYCDILWLKINSTLGIVLYVILSQWMAWFREGDKRAALIAVGLTLNILALPIHGFKWYLHPLYFNHNDLAHVLMLLCFYLMFVGARAPQTAAVATRRFF